MGRPRKWYYGIVRKSILETAKRENTCEQTERYRQAIKKALQETSKDKDGADKVYSIEAVMLKQNKTYVQVGFDLFREATTIQHYISEFVYRVADKVGFDEQ